LNVVPSAGEVSVGVVHLSAGPVPGFPEPPVPVSLIGASLSAHPVSAAASRSAMRSLAVATPPKS